MRATFEIAGARHEAALVPAREGYTLLIGGTAHALTPGALAAGRLRFELDGREVTCHLARLRDTLFLHLEGQTWEIAYLDPVALHQAAAGGGAEDAVRAPMPGTVVAIPAVPGAAVMAGDTLVVIESMKMEIALRAPRDGVIGGVHVAAGQGFDRDALLVSLETGA